MSNHVKKAIEEFMKPYQENKDLNVKQLEKDIIRLILSVKGNLV